MNFGLYPMLERYQTWKHDWEPAALERSRDFIFRNTFADIEYILKEVGEGYGTRFEFECYDVGHLYNLAHMLDRRPGQAAAVRAADLRHPRRHRHRSRGPDAHEAHGRQPVRRRQYLFSILAAGRHQMRLGTMGAIMGGNVRVGLEDSIYLGKGQLAQSNAEQVTQDPQHPRRPLARDRDPGRGARLAAASRAATAWGSSAPAQRGTPFLFFAVFALKFYNFGTSPVSSRGIAAGNFTWNALSCYHDLLTRPKAGTKVYEYVPSPLGGEGGRRPDGPPFGRCPDDLEKTSNLNPTGTAEGWSTNPLPQGERGQNEWALISNAR